MRWSRSTLSLFLTLEMILCLFSPKTDLEASAMVHPFASLDILRQVAFEKVGGWVAGPISSAYVHIWSFTITNTPEHWSRKCWTSKVLAVPADLQLHQDNIDWPHEHKVIWSASLIQSHDDLSQLDYLDDLQLDIDVSYSSFIHLRRLPRPKTIHHARHWFWSNH